MSHIFRLILLKRDTILYIAQESIRFFMGTSKYTTHNLVSKNNYQCKSTLFFYCVQNKGTEIVYLKFTKQE